MVQGLLHGHFETSPMSALALLVSWVEPTVSLLGFCDVQVPSHGTGVALYKLLGLSLTVRRWPYSVMLALCSSHFVPNSSHRAYLQDMLHSCRVHEPESRIWSHDLWGKSEVQGTVSLQKGDRLWETDSLFSNIWKIIWRPHLKCTLWSKCPSGTKEVSLSSFCAASADS